MATELSLVSEKSSPGGGAMMLDPGPSVPTVAVGDQDHIMAPLRLGNLNQVPACVIKHRRRDITERGRRLCEFDAMTFKAGVFGLYLFHPETRERNDVLVKRL